MAGEAAVDGKRKKLKGVAYVQTMILQVYSDYNLPIDPREIDIQLLRVFYNPLIDGTVQIQRSMKEQK